VPASKKGLGRSFESLIPTDLLDESFDPTAEQDQKVSDLRQIKISQITADPDQPRRTFDEEALQELAKSVKEHGVIQPIVVMPHGDGYQIVAGERRFRASQLAGVDKIPALIRTLSGQHKLEISLIENLQRRDLNVIETATAYQKLRDQFNLTLEQIGERVGGKSISAISNTLRLLKLPDVAKNAIVEGKVTEGQMRPLIGLDKKVVESLVPVIISEEWSSRKIEQFIVDRKRQLTNKPAVKNSQVKSIHQEAMQSLENLLKAKIDVKTNTKGAGRIVIKFSNDDDFKRISSLLG
jgi:ParB family chromosome partitioning protein